ncbi:DUF6520 family protein [Maribacter dokdonensis]|uniref:DUF6520 family protein n=1 Tax=Maribacter dokdonensis TaxID=320912 RepID=UPI001C087DB5|nr:DUF6520 family protein [Maribacter dokdonensis]MBU2902956.1 hypothetical protein [Maribacter dokdonensis]
MKTKVFKFMFPAVAIVMAVGLAFAAGDLPVFKTAYYQGPNGIMTTSVGDDCVRDGAISCTYDGFQLYEDPGLNHALGKNP